MPKQLPVLQLLPLQRRSPGATQKGGSGVQLVGGQHRGPAQGLNWHWSLGTGSWPSLHWPRPSGSVHEGGGPPQQGSTHTWPASQDCSPHTGGSPVVGAVVVVGSVVGSAVVLVLALVEPVAVLVVGEVSVVVPELLVAVAVVLASLVVPSGSPGPQAARRRARQARWRE